MPPTQPPAREGSGMLQDVQARAQATAKPGAAKLAVRDISAIHNGGVLTRPAICIQLVIYNTSSKLQADYAVRGMHCVPRCCFAVVLVVVRAVARL